MTSSSAPPCGPHGASQPETLPLARVGLLLLLLVLLAVLVDQTGRVGR
ncbi:hypothetical protein ACFQ60_00115 [Streptomyces zhihengii]